MTIIKRFNKSNTTITKKNPNGINTHIVASHRKKYHNDRYWLSKRSFTLWTGVTVLALLTLSVLPLGRVGFAAEEKKGEGVKHIRKGYFRLDFHKADMEEFLKTMSELMRKNILIDGKVPGKVTIVSPEAIPVENAYTVLETVLAQYGYQPVQSEGVIRIVRISDAVTMNQELRITSEISSFDPSDFGTENINVTHLAILRFVDANAMVAILRNVASKETKIVAFKDANSLVFVGNALEILHLINVARVLDEQSKVTEESASRRNIHIYHLENANAEKLAPILARLPFEKKIMPAEEGEEAKPVQNKPQAGKNEKNEAKVDIIANKETNSLIITADAMIYPDVKAIIQELDIVRKQVLVEALIVEISGDDSWGAGIDWRYGQKINSGAMKGADVGVGTGTGVANDYVASAGLLSGLSMGMVKGDLTDENGNYQVPDGYAFLNVYARDQQVNILSTPQILVTDNEEAEINVGQQVPVVSNMRITDQNNTIRSYDLKNVGIKLKITPHINKNKYVTLEVYQEVKSLVGDTTQLVDIPPIISNRDIKTKITIRDRSTIVIGGLIQSEQTNIERKTPILGDIPILGWLFKRETSTNRKTNLLVFITPYLLEDAIEMDKITERKRLELEKLRKSYDLLDDEESDE